VAEASITNTATLYMQFKFLFALTQICT